jgi:hypothetical protein
MSSSMMTLACFQYSQLRIRTRKKIPRKKYVSEADPAGRVMGRFMFCSVLLALCQINLIEPEPSVIPHSRSLHKQPPIKRKSSNSLNRTIKIENVSCCIRDLLDSRLTFACSGQLGYFLPIGHARLDILLLQGDSIVIRLTAPFESSKIVLSHARTYACL